MGPRALLLSLGTWCLLALLAPAGAAQHTTVHLEKEDALAHVFPEADQVLQLKCLLTDEETASIEKRAGRRLDEGGFYCFVALKGGEPQGYAVIVSQIGKVKPITHIVAAKPDGTVGRVAVMIYRESHGDEVIARRFMAQYEGMELEDPIRIGRDVINIAGSTLSGHAICRGVRKALSVVETLFLCDEATRRANMTEVGQDVTPEELLARNPQGGGPGTGTGSSTGSASGQEAGPDGVAPAPKPDREVTTSAAGSLRLERQVMGTVCSVEAWPAGDMDAAELEAALAAALDEVERWDGVLSDWRDDTPLSRLNAHPAGAAFRPGAELMSWVVDARRWHAETDGAFDPGVGGLVDAWALRTATPRRPAADVLATARAASGLAQLRVTDDGALVRAADGLRLDPGASGKGFALDRAAALLASRGVERALLSFRSTLLALGPPPGRDAWVVPVAHDDAGEAVTTVSLTRGALSVSGGSLRQFVDGDVVRGPVLDPRSGVPVPAARLAWVLHPSASAADALSTALLVAGPALALVPDAEGAWLGAADAEPVEWPARP